MILSALLGGWQIKLMPYASWLAVLPLAVYAASLLQRSGANSGGGRWPVVLLNQATLAGSPRRARPCGAVAGTPPGPAGADARACFRTSSMGGLARLPAGTRGRRYRPRPVRGGGDPAPGGGGALSPAGQGHPRQPRDPERLARGGRRQLQSLGVDYLALCAPPAPTRPSRPTPCAPACWANRPIPFLQELAPAPGKPIRVWRVRPAG